jgi:type II secretory pathway component PulF
MCYILLVLLAILFIAAVYIGPVIAEFLTDMSNGQEQLPVPLERLLNLGQLVLNSWPFFLVLYVTLIAGLVWWCLALRRKC